MKREVSIRFRLTVWYATVLAAGLIVFAALIWLSLRQILMSELDESLASRAHNLELFLRSELAEKPPPPLKDEVDEFCQAFPLGTYLRVLQKHGDFAFSYPHAVPLPRAPNGSPDGYTNLVWKGHLYRSFRGEISAQNGAYAIEIGAPLDTIQHVLKLLQTLLLALLPAVVLLACAGGLWLSRSALQAVDAMTTAARSISLENLSSRLRVPQTGDELQRLAEAWNNMLVRLESAVKTLSQFAADASHELRTPLSAIRTGAELALRRSRSAEQYRDSLKEIVTESERMTQMLEDLLFLARNDADSAEMPMQTVDLSEVLQEVCSEVQALAEFRSVHVRHELPGSPVLAKGNRPALRRLFLVLLDNAIKYSQPEGDVRVELSTNAEGHEIVIKDFGIGIDAQDLPHIFKRFYRSNAFRTHSNDGYGLGLSLAESIARRHQAKITVESSPGKGSTFRVLLPKEQSSTEPAEIQEPRDALV